MYAMRLYSRPGTRNKKQHVDYGWRGELAARQRKADHCPLSNSFESR